MKYANWSNYPTIDTNIHSYQTTNQLAALSDKLNNFISAGNGRSYGDCSLNSTILSCLSHRCLLHFDESIGLLKAQAGVLLTDIIAVFLPRGWFLKVTPGTQMITLGGAIASDVHGKNHHIQGCFSNSIHAFTLMLPSGEIIRCTPTENSKIFHATCGGMGLTGIILDVDIFLKKVPSSYINQTTIKTRNLQETLDAFSEYSDVEYSVAWIDCLSKNKTMGRGLVSLGQFDDSNDFSIPEQKKITVPKYFPENFINEYTINIFNHIYYHKNLLKQKHRRVIFDRFFYPLDGFLKWNRLYGRSGFIQYQFILPIEKSYDGLHTIMEIITQSGMASFLAVLKLHGSNNKNYLSFPIKGYSLALDFNIQPDLFPLLEKIDCIVTDLGGRIYLAKDARMSKKTFQSGYPDHESFRQLRIEYGLMNKISSMQSIRLGI